MKHFQIPLVCLVMACSPLMTNALDKLATASSLICDSLALRDKYSEDVNNVKELIEAKDYLAALFVVKSMYAEAQANGDTATVEQLVPLMTTLNSLASKLPLSIQKPQNGNKVL